MNLDTFRENGYLRLPQFVLPSVIKSAQRQIDAIMMGDIRSDEFRYQLVYDENYERSGEQETPGHKEANLNYRKITGLEHDEVFNLLVVAPVVRDIMLRLFDGDISIFRAMFINKPAGSQEHLPWHQDVPTAQRWNLDTNRAVFVWTALDEATRESGCLQVVPGSHKRGAWHDDHFPTDEDIALNEFEKNKIYLEMGEGDSVLVDNFLMHKSDINKMNIPRRAFSVCYIDAHAQNTQTEESYPVVFGV